jgi:hypothetical protein
VTPFLFESLLFSTAHFIISIGGKIVFAEFSRHFERYCKWCGRGSHLMDATKSRCHSERSTFYCRMASCRRPKSRKVSENVDFFAPILTARQGFYIFMSTIWILTFWHSIYWTSTKYRSTHTECHFETKIAITTKGGFSLSQIIDINCWKIWVAGY